MKPKIKIVQYFIGDNQKYLHLCDIVKQLNVKYCSIHGYEYQFLFLLKPNIDVIIFKMKYIYEQLLKQDCDYLVFLDADAAVSKPTVKIEELVDFQHELFLSRNNQRYGIINVMVNLYNKLTKKINDRTGMETLEIDSFGEDIYGECQQLSLSNIHHNEGLYIVKNTPMMRQFFKDCVQFSNFYTGNTIKSSQGTDGRTIQYLLQLKKYNSIYTYTPNYTQGGIACSFEFKYDEDKTFVLHNYGYALNIDQKIDQFEQLKNNKWWKEILKQ